MHDAILGNGPAGWMAAASRAQTLGGSQRLAPVEPEEIGTVGAGEATILPLQFGGSAYPLETQIQQDGGLEQQARNHG